MGGGVDRQRLEDWGMRPPTPEIKEAIWEHLRLDDDLGSRKLGMPRQVMRNDTELPEVEVRRKAKESKWVERGAVLGLRIGERRRTSAVSLHGTLASIRHPLAPGTYGACALRAGISFPNISIYLNLRL